MLSEKLARPASLVLAVVVAALTFTTVGNAIQTVTVPNAASVTYNLAAGANTGAITPVANQPVLVMGCQFSVGFRGVAQATILRIPASFIEWVGLESTAGAAITQGFSGTAGTHILYLDFSHQVDIEVNSPDTIRIHNGSAGVRTGNVRLIW